MHRPLFAGCFGDCEPTSVEDANVRYGSLADIKAWIRDVRFTPKSRLVHLRYRCPLSANIRHGAASTQGATNVLRL